MGESCVGGGAGIRIRRAFGISVGTGFAARLGAGLTVSRFAKRLGELSARQGPDYVP